MTFQGGIIKMKYFIVYKTFKDETTFKARVCDDLESANNEATWLVNCGHAVNSIYVFKTIDCLIRNWKIEFKESKKSNFMGSHVQSRENRNGG